jgi:hypothetical protein
MAFLFTVWYSEMVAALLALTTFSADAAQAQVYQDDVVNATGGVTPNVTASAHPDIIAVLNVTGNVTPGVTWADSYSVGHNCYCASTFDHNVGSYYVETPLGWLTVREVCDLLGPGPGISGNPVYNDIQCGNGPPNDAGDEHVCPGRTDIGVEGCGHIGPNWNFEPFITGPAPVQNVTASVHPDIVAVLNVTGNVTPGGVTWADSYSVGHNCYCASTFDHNVGSYYVDTPLGWLTVREVCDLLGPGPGISGNPVYNDIQCGNGPPNDAGDEHVCPGRTDIGVEGCGHIGPKWNFASYITSSPTVLTTTAAPSASASVSPTMKLSLVPSHSPSSTLSSDSSSLSPSNYPLDSPLSPPSMLPFDSPSYATPIGSDSPLLPSTPTSGGHEQFRYISQSSIVIASLLSVATVLSS